MDAYLAKDCDLKEVLCAAEGEPLVVIQDRYNRDVLLSAFERGAQMPLPSVFVIVVGLQGAGAGERVLPKLIFASRRMRCEPVIIERFNEEVIRRSCNLPEEAEVCAVIGFELPHLTDAADLPETVYFEKFGAHSIEEAERPSKAGGPMQSSVKCCGE